MVRDELEEATETDLTIIKLTAEELEHAITTNEISDTKRYLDSYCGNYSLSTSNPTQKLLEIH